MKANKIVQAIGQSLHCLQRDDLAGAEKLIRKVLKAAPDHVEALHILGAILATQNELDGAIKLFKKAATLNPNNSKVQFNLAKALVISGNEVEALPHYQKATLLTPGYGEVWSSYGNTLNTLHRYDDALASYDTALHLNPHDSAVWANRGITLTALKRYDESRLSQERALALNGRNAFIWDNYATTLKLMGRYDAALMAYAQALQIEPSLDYTYGSWLHMKMMVCDWSDLDQAFTHLAAQIEAGHKIASPFVALTTPLSARLQRRCAELFMTTITNAASRPPLFSSAVGSDRITVGYFSADFHDHATTYLMAELFERHDKSKFRVIGFSFGPHRQDVMRQRITAALDEFIEVRDQSDAEVAALARNLRVDIAVDLKGFTEEHRVGILAQRAAPIQVSYLGYPGTMAAPFIDYLIADHRLIDSTTREFYTEKIAYLPHSYQVNDSSKKIADRRYSRAEQGLPERGFIFCCFNNNYKITPDLFAIWMRLLAKIPESVLWLLGGHPAAVLNLQKQAETRGVDSRRLVFAERLPLADHLARHRLADLFLDTFYYNAHTSASDALWAGVPVLTRSGETFASRVATSLLSALGLPELITNTVEEYEASAYLLATQPAKLAAIRARLAENVALYPLFDTALFTHHIERAYTQMYERSLLKLPPDHIDIQPE